MAFKVLSFAVLFIIVQMGVTQNISKIQGAVCKTGKIDEAIRCAKNSVPSPEAEAYAVQLATGNQFKSFAEFKKFLCETAEFPLRCKLIQMYFAAQSKQAEFARMFSGAKQCIEPIFQSLKKDMKF